jgi:hypothetical protein
MHGEGKEENRRWRQEEDGFRCEGSGCRWAGRPRRAATDVGDARHRPNQAITSTGNPRATQDQASPQLSDTSAVTRPVADNIPSPIGQAQSLKKGDGMGKEGRCKRGNPDTPAGAKRRRAGTIYE